MSGNQDETDNYLRLVCLYIDLCTGTVLDVFRYLSPGNDPDAFLKSKENKLIRLKSRGILNKQQCELLLVKDVSTGRFTLKSPINLHDFDISLLITLSTNLFTNVQLPPPSQGWGTPPTDGDISIAADLLRLRTTRNVIVGHYPRARLSKDRFEEEWQNVSDILIRIQQQITPGNGAFVQAKIDAYRSQILDSRLKKYEEKLRDWHDAMTKMQDEVEDLLKKLDGFDGYFKNKCDWYERYAMLLVKGGRFVLSSFLDELIKKHGKDLRSLLDENKETIQESINDSKHLDVLYPPETNSQASPSDVSSWNVSILAAIIQQLFDDIGRTTKQSLQCIGDAYRNYAEHALIAFDSNAFVDYFSDLKASLKNVSENLSEDHAAEYYRILDDSKKKIEESEFQTYMDELKTQGTQIKTFTDIFKETLQKTKDYLQDMITHGISFKTSHVLELKMITLGNDEEKKQLAENILKEIWHEALERSIQNPKFPDVKKEVENILEQIRKSKSVENITPIQACIILQMSCISPRDMLELINYFESSEFHESLNIISKELGYHFDTALAIKAFIPVDNLWGILNHQNDLPVVKEEGIRVPISVSSPAGMLKLRSLFKSETIANSTNAIANALSKHLDGTITLKVETDMKKFRDIFDEGSDSSNDSSTSESNIPSSSAHIPSNKPVECFEEQSSMSNDEKPLEDGTGSETETLLMETLEEIRQILDDIAAKVKIRTGKDTQKIEQNLMKITSDFEKEIDKWTKTQGELSMSVQIYPVGEIKKAVRLFKEALHEIGEKLPTGAEEIYNKQKAGEVNTDLLTKQNSGTMDLHWMSAATGLNYFKEGLECFCDDVVKKQHEHLLSKCNRTCTECVLDTLKPNHTCIIENNIKRCPLGPKYCNCLKPNHALVQCPNETCGVIYDEIINIHRSNPPAPNWMNTNIKEWYSNPWAIAACFVKANGYRGRTSAAEFDCSELLSVIIYDKTFLDHLDSKIDGTDPFSKAVQIRNNLLHSPSLHIKEEEARMYISIMIDALQDGKELSKRKEACQAVKTLKELMEMGLDLYRDIEMVRKVQSLEKVTSLASELQQEDSKIKGEVNTDLLTKQNSGTMDLHWMSAARGLNYFKEGLECFCDDVVKKQHEQFLSKCNRPCTECVLDTLKPNHTCIIENNIKRCPLGPKYCNCLKPNHALVQCPNETCGVIYDEIINIHRSNPPAPNWMNTNIKEWYWNPWAIAACFVKANGYRGRTSVAEFDCSGLLSVIIYDKIFLDHLDSKIDGTDPFSKAVQIRNNLFHSPSLQIKEEEVRMFISIMIDALQDGKELSKRKEACQAVKKLKEMEMDFDIFQDIVVARKVQSLEKDTSLESELQQEDSKIKALFQTDDNAVQKHYEIPTIRRPHDGRLIMLTKGDVRDLLYNCDTVLKGGFSQVHISSKKVPGLDLRVVIKEIVVDRKEEIKMLSVTNEKIASRIMHFAIVPLIAYMDETLDNKRAFYFLSPYIENGNLRKGIESDKQCSDIKNIQLKHQRRIEILFQVASALDYLHKPVHNYRGIVLHRDLTSRNIVLDSFMNARVNDFGLACEVNEGETRTSYTESLCLGTPGYYSTSRYSKPTVHEDYYSFGVVIRELLTGVALYMQNGSGVSELTKFDELLINKMLQRNIWEGSIYVETLVSLSTRCLKSKMTNLSAAEIVKTLDTMSISPTDFTTADEYKCHICMVNRAGEDSPQHGCRMNVCVSCMRNSHINPIKCRVCNGDVIPKIDHGVRLRPYYNADNTVDIQQFVTIKLEKGHTTAALLIAGNDVKNEKFANSLKNEIEEIKGVLVSMYPCVIGCREENVRIVTPSYPGKPEQLLPHVYGEINRLKSRKGLETLLLYFTGNHFPASGFQLGGPEEILTLNYLEEALMQISEKWGSQTRILLFWDCYHPSSVEEFILELPNASLKIIQLNACRPYETSDQPQGGSTLQKFFIQALTRRCFNKQCPNTTIEKECAACEMTGDFISIAKLLKYISDHMSKKENEKQPVIYTKNIALLDASIGYNVDFVVDFEFKFGEQGKHVKLTPRIFYDIEELKKNILENVISDHDEQSKSKAGYDEQPKEKLTPVEFSDAIALRINNGPEDGQELRSMLNVASAMNGNWEIFASYRTTSNILNGRVAVFVSTERMIQYLDDKDLLEHKDENRKVVTLSFFQLKSVIDEIAQTTDLAKIHRCLLKVYDRWMLKKNRENVELEVIFPCINDDNFHDIMVLDFSIKSDSSP